MYKNILIASDGSELSDKGVDYGLKLAHSLKCQATVITVLEPAPQLAGSGADWIPNAEDITRYNATRDAYADKLLERAAASAAELGVSIDTRRVENDLPAEAIISEADKEGCDLIVMASHGRRGLSRLLLGSQTAEVLTRSKIPVLVVR